MIASKQLHPCHSLFSQLLQILFWLRLSSSVVLASPEMAKSCYAAGRNKMVVLEALRPRLELYRINQQKEELKLLEIASGTGEHAALLAANMPFLVYQPSEPDSTMHESIAAWSEKLPNVLQPLALDVSRPLADQAQLLPEGFHEGEVDAMLNINMIHISPFHCTQGLMQLAGHCLCRGGMLLTYGPYRVNGFMVESNLKFDESLRARDPSWGVRDLEEVVRAAEAVGLVLADTLEVPANNLILVFQKT